MGWNQQPDQDFMASQPSPPNVPPLQVNKGFIRPYEGKPNGFLKALFAGGVR